MKKLGFALFLWLSCGLALAESAPHVLVLGRDILLTSKGTLFSVERVEQKDLEDPEAVASNFLRLKVDEGDKSKTFNVPGTLSGGTPSSPTLAFDSESDTLFVFWQKQPNRLSSELLLCSFRDGEWGPVTSIDNAAFHLRFNLRIGVTKSIQYLQSKGEPVTKPGVVVHATWWDQSAYGESARYAMISLESGKAQSIEVRELIEFAGERTSQVAPDFSSELDRDILRHPAIIESAVRDSVDVIFADVEKKKFHRVTIQPVIHEDGRIRLPIGRHRGAFAAPRTLTLSDSVYVLPGSSPENLLFFAKTGKSLEYIVHTNQGWSATKNFRLGEDLSTEAGIEALRKMIASQ
ncbi:MAG TPA: hypothetical protein VNM92_13365 [Thermoanaerobaculia bacterium]|nr:hypothetical protein [Thermoanaerobaculia bacterium]